VVAPEPEAIATGIARFFNENRAQEFIGKMDEAKAPFSWEKLMESVEGVAGWR
jgi:hypothetical protein